MSDIKHDENQITQYFVGPLNLNRQDKRATTVMGTELTLDADEFDALDMLAECEGDPLTFERLYETVWSEGDCSRDRSVALMRLENLIGKISEIGEGLMWIEYEPETGYSFRTRWEHNLQKRN